MKKLEREYTDTIASEILLPMIMQTSPVSLRALDWAVVNWSKEHNVVCSSPIAGQMTNVHHSYRTTLAFWKRRLFDPFRRRTRIQVRIGDDWYETTLGQANFAMWCYTTGTFAYVLGHLTSIEASMNEVARRQKRERRNEKLCGVRKRRSELTPSARAICVAYPACVTFASPGREK